MAELLDAILRHCEKLAAETGILRWLRCLSVSFLSPDHGAVLEQLQLEFSQG